MSTNRATVAHFEDQLAGLPFRTQPMFGEYCLYVDNKVVGFITDNVLRLKPVGVDAEVLEGTFLGEAYPGSKLYHSVPPELADDEAWLQRAVLATAELAPASKPRRPRAPKPQRERG
ncbi:MAG TPA: TfoX/Sxy family protein [Pseudolysinimonas sp.]|nr:TfoX/Sxy family protein [Pseudolysinimonas sp.]